MVTPLFIWIGIFAVIVLVALAEFLGAIHHARTDESQVHHPVIEMGGECEEVWIPGDPLSDSDLEESEEI